MPGSLVKIKETTVSSAVSAVTLTGIDSTYDVYMVQYSDLQIDTDSKFLELRYTVSGTADSSSNYDYALKDLKADTSFGMPTNSGANAIPLDNTGTATGEALQGTLYLFNFNNSGEYSYHTQETFGYNTNGSLRGRQGGGVLKEEQVTDGISIGRFADSGTNIDNGTFTLYGLKN